MTAKHFADEQGRDWEVWEVARDRIERRGSTRPAGALGSDSGLEEQRQAERRRRTRIPERLRDGWLAFHCPEQHRRLAPVPQDWTSMTDDEFRGLLARAEVVPLVQAPEEYTGARRPPE